MKYLKKFNESNNSDDLYNQFLDIRDVLISLEDKDIVTAYRIYIGINFSENEVISFIVDTSSEESIKDSFEKNKISIDDISPMFYMTIRLDIRKKKKDYFDDVKEIVYYIDFLKSMGYNNKVNLVLDDIDYISIKFNI